MLVCSDSDEPATDVAFMRRCVTAIVKVDAMDLMKALSSRQIAPNAAMTLAKQALCRDKLLGTVGYRARFDGLLGAVFAGVGAAQRMVQEHGPQPDNAVSLLCGLATLTDDVAVVDSLFAFDPNFRVGPVDKAADINDVVSFFANNDAPRCAARVAERRSELVMAMRDDHVRSLAVKRMLRRAASKLKGETDELSRIFLKDLLDEERLLLVDVVPGLVFTFGITLATGESELAIQVAPEVDASTHHAKAKLLTLAERRLAGIKVETKADATIPVLETLSASLLRAGSVPVQMV